MDADTDARCRPLYGRRIWDWFTPDYNCPLLKERVGRIGDGGKWVCGLRSNVMHGRRCLVYSLGSAGDTSFEDALLSDTDCEVHTFGADITAFMPRNIIVMYMGLTHAGACADPTLPESLQAVIEAKPGLHFHSIGVGSGSAVPAPGRTAIDASKMQSLEGIMRDLQHSWIDILKIDIEMHEWGLFTDFYRGSSAGDAGPRLPATQLLVEFHFPGQAATVWEVLDLITADNYRVFSVEPNYYCENGCCARDLIEFAFIKVSDEGQICAPIHQPGKHGGGLVLLPGC